MILTVSDLIGVDKNVYNIHTQQVVTFPDSQSMFFFLLKIQDLEIVNVTWHNLSQIRATLNIFYMCIDTKDDRAKIKTCVTDEP